MESAKTLAVYICELVILNFTIKENVYLLCDFQKFCEYELDNFIHLNIPSDSLSDSLPRIGIGGMALISAP